MNMPPQSRFWRKKPVTIEAVQWFKMGDHPKVELYAHGDDKGQEHLGCIKTLESGKSGFHIVSVGDWIIKGVKGEYYACKPDIFALTYEPVDAPASESLPQEPPALEPAQCAYVNLNNMVKMMPGLGRHPLLPMVKAQLRAAIEHLGGKEFCDMEDGQ